jgi:hypothetical protein
MSEAHPVGHRSANLRSFAAEFGITQTSKARATRDARTLAASSSRSPDAPASHGALDVTLRPVFSRTAPRKRSQDLLCSPDPRNANGDNRAQIFEIF